MTLAFSFPSEIVFAINIVSIIPACTRKLIVALSAIQGIGVSITYQGICEVVAFNERTTRVFNIDSFNKNVIFESIVCICLNVIISMIVEFTDFSIGIMNDIGIVAGVSRERIFT